MKYKAEEYAFQIDTPLISDNIDKTRREKIFHYTNLDALISILKNRTLKFNRIDNVNDQSEKLFINDQEVINQVFVCCFSYRVSEYIPHWYMYSKDVYGIRLAIYKKKGLLTTDGLLDYSQPIAAYKNGTKLDELSTANYDSNFAPTNDEWFVDFKSIDVIYDSKFAEDNPIIREFADGRHVIDLSTLGTVKDEAWKFEDETRMIAHLRYLNDTVNSVDYDYLLAPIKYNNIDKIEIVCGPWMTGTLKETVKEICSTYLGGVKFDVKSSKFDGAIRR